MGRYKSFNRNQIPETWKESVSKKNWQKNREERNCSFISAKEKAQNTLKNQSLAVLEKKKTVELILVICMYRLLHVDYSIYRGCNLCSLSNIVG